MATVTWDSGVTSKGQADGVSYTYTNTNFATQLNTIPPFAKINSVKITAKFQVNLYTNNGGLTVGSKTWEVDNTNNHDWITIVNNEDITAYLTGASETANAGELPSVTIYANKRMGFVRTFKTQVIITWDYTPRYQYSFGTNDINMGACRGTRLYNEGETVTAEAVPKSGYRFVKWSDGSTENPRIFTASKDTELTAYFELDKINNIYVNTSQSSEVLVNTVEASGVLADTTKVYE